MDEDEYLDEPTTAEELEARVDDLEAQLEEVKEGHGSSAIGPYLFGSCLAMILSWSRNGSILLCIGHGITSWIYVIYFAWTRHWVAYVCWDQNPS